MLFRKGGEAMKVFVKRYPEKGELPKVDGEIILTNHGALTYSKTFGWVNLQYYPTKRPEYWLEEIELPSEDEIEQASNRYYFDLEEKRETARDFKGQIAGRHPDMLTSREMFAQMSGFIDGVKFLKNHLKSNTNGN